MLAVDIIIKKRDGGELSKQEIDFFVDGIVSGDIPDYQTAAWAMAVLLRGMTQKETTDLTLAMAQSGEMLDLSDAFDIVVDKHSTGGVGDKTTLVIEPAVVACGLPMGKMSGHALGFSGGTLDKMESIPGFRTDLSTQEFINQLKNEKIVLTGQTLKLAPADGKLYALRDVTGTVQSIPLIASSVMCKKIAGGANGILLDVKVGNGAFMRTVEEARELAELMVAIAQRVDRKAIALISDMNQPLGCAVGNALELIEAIETLQGGGPEDFLEHCLIVAAHLLVLGGVAEDEDHGKSLASRAIQDGSAWERFRRLVIAQDGDVAYIDEPSRLLKAHFKEIENTNRSGFIAGIDACMVAESVIALGGGRRLKGDKIDHSVGVIINRNVGDFVETGQPLFQIYANDEAKLEEARIRLNDAHSWSDNPVERLPLFYDVIKS
jgi:pyrimidine-nucleoside phosphorylase